MPAKDSLHLQLSPDAEATTKLIRKDVDNLVQNIKDNLKLSFEAVHHDKAAASNQPPLLSAPSYADYHHHAAASLAAAADPHQMALPRYPASSSRKARSYMSSKGSSRASPYALPPKCDCDEVSGRPGSWAARKRYPSMSAGGGGKPKISEMDDPLEMLQELISEGNLLKEAVRRLQLGLTPKIQRSFYDSDEDCRSPTTTTTNSHFTDLREEVGIN